MMQSFQPLSIEDKILWLRLILSKGIGPVRFWKLFQEREGDLPSILRHLPDPCDEATAEQELLLHEQKGIQLIAACEPNFPSNLRQLRDCPPLLSVCGNVDLLQQTSIAIVGARNASVVGKIFSTKMAERLSACGIVTVSGMARGIDSAVHLGSLNGGTIAVLAGGLDVIYPAENVSLYKNIMDTGVLISEMPLGTQIDVSLFPRRNRLISGLANWVVLVEAAAQSGSLITAKYAIDQGKEVFAVPGFPTDPRSSGCNQLIKQGATLVESAEDILALIAESPFKGVSQTVEVQVGFEEETNNSGSASLKSDILNALNAMPTSIEMLFQSQNCSLPHLLSALSELETEGKIIRHPNSDVSLHLVAS